MDDELHPIAVEKWESTLSSPLIRVSSTTPLADTAIELCILVLSRFWEGWKWKKTPAIPREFNPREDAFRLLASRLLSASLAAVESWAVDKLLQRESRLRALYALGVGLQRMRTHGVLGPAVGNAISGSDIIHPDHYMSTRAIEYLIQSLFDVVGLIWRLVRLKTGPDLFSYCISPLMLLVYCWTTWTIFVLQDRQDWDIWSGAAIGLVVLLAVGFPRFLLDLVARIPEANKRSVRRAATTLAAGKKQQETGSVYVHRPLKRVRDIRLLQLMPRNSLRRDVVRAELLHISLDSARDYDCISYTWGDLSKINDSYILVEGKRLSCSPKVHAMLLDLADSTKRLVWIDLFCINQTDLMEKGRQVSMMKDIYRGATGVVAWLEPLHDISLIRRLYQGWTRTIWDWIFHPLRSLSESHLVTRWRSRPMKEGALSEYDKAVAEAGLNLFRNDWFNRVWIIQEVVMANHPPQIHYGDVYLDWSEVMAVAEAILGRGWLVYLCDFSPSERSRVHGAVKAIKTINSLSFRVQEGMSIELADALQECSLFKASFAEDKVFALMGFTGDLYHRGIQPHYDQSVDTIYKSTAAYLYSSNITGYEAQTSSAYPLRALHSAGVGLERRMASLPSWVPDWSVPWPSTILSCTDISASRLREYRASGTSPVSGGLTVAGDKVVLRLEGAIIDEISCLTDPLGLETKYSIDGPYSSILGGGLYCESIGWDAEPDPENAYIRDRDAILSWHRQAMELRTEEIEDPYPHVRGQSATDAFWLTLVGNSACESQDGQHVELEPGSSTYDKFMDAGRKCLALFERGGNEAEGLTSMTLRFRPTYIHAGRRFATTEDGYMGLVPAGTRHGDLVCIIYGAQTPFLLRRTAGGYVVVGECYIHGVMDGEKLPSSVQTDLFQIL